MLKLYLESNNLRIEDSVGAFLKNSRTLKLITNIHDKQTNYASTY